MFFLEHLCGSHGAACWSPSGIPIKTTLDSTSTVQYAGLIHQLLMKARTTIRDIDPQNDLTFLRVRSKKNEIMIAPGEQNLQNQNQTLTLACPGGGPALRPGAPVLLHLQAGPVRPSSWPYSLFLCPHR